MEKTKLRLHLLLCKTCPEFSQRNTKFTALCQKAKLQSLSEEDKGRMREVLEKWL